MKTTIAVLAISILFASACTPSEKAIRDALAKTETAAPTLTVVVTPSFTPSPVPSITPSPTPDLRIIRMESKNFLLSLDDLPMDGKYYLPNAKWTSPHLNSEIVQDMGADKGQRYINETGRIEGWWVDFLRGSSKFSGPEEIYNNVIRYQSIDGVKIYMQEYAGADVAGFVEIENSPLIGDVS